MERDRLTVIYIKEPRGLILADEVLLVEQHVGLTQGTAKATEAEILTMSKLNLYLIKKN